MNNINRHFKYYTDGNKLIHIKISYTTLIKTVSATKRLIDGGFNNDDYVICAMPNSNRNIRPRYIVIKYFTELGLVKLKVIFKTLPLYLSFINDNKDKVFRYVGEDANPNTIKIIK